MLALIRAYNNGSLPIKCIGIDEGLFPEHYEFMNQLKEAWNIDFEWYKDNHFVSDYIKAGKSSKSDIVARFKTDAVGKIVREMGWKVVFVGIRWDEHEARSKERYFSPRGDHIRVHPILHWSEKEIWDYMIQHNIPFSILYKMGFRSLGNADLTTPTPKGGSERDGRDPSKEGLMYILRQFGYF
jgi:phosphoadenosine phosphosulfate reductase